MSALFSIFLPVRNGQAYIKECVGSILSQTFPGFELHVLDNASTDKTVELVEEFRDSRIRVWRSNAPAALSIEENWSRMKGLPKNEFMTFLGHDDLYDPYFLETVKNLIERYPDASLYQTGFRLINARGRTIRSGSSIPERETASRYLEERFSYRRDAVGTGFVMRSSDYDRLGGIPSFKKLLFADDALWLSLMKISWKAADVKEAFSVRIHDQSVSSLPDWQSTIEGLGQFSDFLKEFIRSDPDSAKVYHDFASAFFLRYHQSAYAYALLDACRHKMKIDDSVFQKIGTSLIKTAARTGEDLRGSSKVRALEILNGPFWRCHVDAILKFYYRLRTKSLW
ncbi:MAG: glycosyltransferase [Candidatus Omnitrophota bacterium]